MPLHTGRLVLTPADPLVLTDPPRLRRALAEAGFIGEPLDTRAGRFLIGPCLLDLLTFTGCAVQVETTPTEGAGGAFCHVHLPPPTPSPRLLAGRNTRAPRCPACRARLTDWRERIADWSQEVRTFGPVPGMRPCRSALGLGLEAARGLRTAVPAGRGGLPRRGRAHARAASICCTLSARVRGAISTSRTDRPLPQRAARSGLEPIIRAG